MTASPRRRPFLRTMRHRHVDVVGAGQVAGGADERVVVEDIEDARDRLNDVVLTQLGVGVAAAAGLAATLAAPAVTEAAAAAAAPARRRRRRRRVVAAVLAAFWPRF